MDFCCVMEMYLFIAFTMRGLTHMLQKCNLFESVLEDCTRHCGASAPDGKEQVRFIEEEN